LLAQAPARPELSIKLVDPKMLRVCADPHNMPFSTERGEGFENKLAELLAAQLGKGLTYTWYPQAPGFVGRRLRAGKAALMDQRCLAESRPGNPSYNHFSGKGFFTLLEQRKSTAIWTAC
jgi:hypothetical protein